MLPEKCSHCGGEHLLTSNIAANGNEGPRLLPKLGSFLFSPRLDVVLCVDCGLTQYFAEESARQKATQSPGVWRPIAQQGRQ